MFIEFTQIKLILKFLTPLHFKLILKIFFLQNRGESSGTPGTRTSNVLPDLLSQASPATPPRHDKSSSEEVRPIFFTVTFQFQIFRRFSLSVVYVPDISIDIFCVVGEKQYFSRTIYASSNKMNIFVRLYKANQRILFSIPFEKSCFVTNFIISLK